MVVGSGLPTPAECARRGLPTPAELLDMAREGEEQCQAAHARHREREMKEQRKKDEEAEAEYRAGCARRAEEYEQKLALASAAVQIPRSYYWDPTKSDGGYADFAAREAAARNNAEAAAGEAPPQPASERLRLSDCAMRSCRQCGRFEPFQDLTEECCWAVHGVRCVFPTEAPAPAARAATAGPEPAFGGGSPSGYRVF